jgi:predicted TIM-barrel fold metal-dependent hydrolase
MTYDEMRPGCYERDARVADFALNGVDGSLPFPTFPRFCGQTFLEAQDHDLGLACVRAFNDWMVEEWCGPSGGVNLPLGILPLWDAALAADEVRRTTARGVRAWCFSEIPPRLGLPSIHSGGWDPLFAAVDEVAGVLCMHIGSSSTMPAASPDAPEAVGGTLAFNNAFASMADWLFSGKLIDFPSLKLAYSEGQIGWIPYALERADTVWEHHDPWMHTKERIPEPPSTYYWGRIFGCFTADRHGLANLDAVGRDNICFETDYPHTDTTWPESRAYAEAMVAGLDEETTYKVLRGNAIAMLGLDRE